MRFHLPISLFWILKSLYLPLAGFLLGGLILLRAEMLLKQQRNILSSENPVLRIKALTSSLKFKVKNCFNRGSQ